ncbi:MAG TPA: DUF2934 domain-containing protein [Pseudomonas sp.]|nr:DUF2934 domain-containing protein [Pseudomonas sp.]
MSVDYQRIRELAYQIWEAEGQPSGQEERHWQMACKLAEAEKATESKPTTRLRRISKPSAVTLAEVETEKPALLKKPRASRATPKKT